MIKTRKKLSVKISAVLTLTFMFCVTSLGFLYWASESRKAQSVSKKSFEQAKVWAQKVFAEPLWSYNQDLIQELTNTMMISPEKFIVDIQVLDRDGQIISEAKSDLKKEASDLKESIPIYHHEEIVGEIKLTARPKDVWSYLKNLKNLIWGSAILFTLFLAFSSFMTLETLLSQPLNELTESLQQIEKANYKIKLTKRYSSELEELAKSFRNAIAGIEKRDIELSKHNTNLESLVDSRTKERDIERMKSVNSAKLATLGEISAGIAHEINNPLTIIQGHVSSIESKMPDMGNSQIIAKDVEKIKSTIERIAKIIRGLQFFSRNSSLDDCSYFSVQNMLFEVQTLCSAKIKDNEVALKMTIPDREVKIYGQEIQISQIIVNLISNAVDALAGVENPTIEVLLQTTDDRCIISVSDNGCGIPAEVQKRIFEPFFTTKASGKGTGLGLSIAHNIAQHHNGHLSVQSQKGHTEFILDLPIRYYENKKAS